MEECVFCKIVRRGIPSETVYEDELTMVFMDIAGDVDGHMVAIPKKHVENLSDCDDETLFRLMATVRKVAGHCVDGCGYDGVNLLCASGAGAGQSVGHFHIHMVPRTMGDGIDAWPRFNGAKEDIRAMRERLRL